MRSLRLETVTFKRVVIIINVLIILVLVIINTATDHASNLS